MRRGTRVKKGAWGVASLGGRLRLGGLPIEGVAFKALVEEPYQKESWRSVFRERPPS